MSDCCPTRPHRPEPSYTLITPHICWVCDRPCQRIRLPFRLWRTWVHVDQRCERECSHGCTHHENCSEAFK